MARHALILLILLAVVGCQTNTDSAALPTLADLNALATDDAATAMALASPTREPLPPTFTPSPTFTVTPTSPVDVPTLTPEGFRPTGTLYYIINGDALVELAADGSFEDLLPIPHIGQDVSGLALSPTDDLLAYIAPGAGSAREVYITDRQGSATRQMSQLGFAEVQTPVWRPDGAALAVIAAQGPGAPRSIYLLDIFAGTQRPVLQLPSTELRDLTWNQDGTRLYFSDKTIFSLDLLSGQVSPSLTATSGFGPDFAVVHSPTTPELYYLKTLQDLDTGQRGGVLSFFTTEAIPEIPVERPGAKLFVDDLAYSRDGAWLLISGETGVWVQDQLMQIATNVVLDAAVPPQPALSPDAEQVAYVDLDGQGIQQIYVVNRRGGPPTQLTFHQDGIISDLVWAEG
jgi:hypothetical protein